MRKLIALLMVSMVSLTFLNCTGKERHEQEGTTTVEVNSSPRTIESATSTLFKILINQ